MTNKKAVDSYDTLVSLLEKKMGKNIALGEDYGELKMYRAQPATSNKPSSIKAIIYFKATNTFKILTFIHHKEDKEVLFEYSGNFKEAKCLMSDDINEALRHLRFKDVVRCLKHHNDTWIFQNFNEDTEKVLHYRSGRFAINSRSKGHDINHLDIAVNDGFNVRKAHDCVMSVIFDTDEKALYLDYFHFDKKSGEYKGISGAKFNNPNEEMVRSCLNGSILIDGDSIHALRN